LEANRQSAFTLSLHAASQMERYQQHLSKYRARKEMSKIAGRVNQFGIVCLFYTGIAFAPEKHSRIDSSDLIATGRLTNFVAYPWFDGWHISGDIVIDRVLGTKVPLTTREISYAFVCCCSWSSIRELRRISETSGIWYLRSKAGSWQPAGWSCGDPGYSPIRSRKDLEDLRRAIVSRGNRLVEPSHQP
jgi:hypothetical protein